MRRLVALFILVFALLPQSARADAVSCEGTAPTFHSSIAYPLSPDGSCTVPFTLAADGPVTITITPSPTFTGSLEGIVRQGITGFSVKGLFVAGVLILGGAEREVPLNSGDWILEVRAGYSPPCLPYPVPCELEVGFAVGGFSGSAG